MSTIFLTDSHKVSYGVSALLLNLIFDLKEEDAFQVISPSPPNNFKLFVLS